MHVLFYIYIYNIRFLLQNIYVIKSSLVWGVCKCFLLDLFFYVCYFRLFFPPTILIFYIFWQTWLSPLLRHLSDSAGVVSTHLVTCANERGSRDTLVHSKLVFLRVILRDWTIIRKMPVHAMFQSLAFV